MTEVIIDTDKQSKRRLPTWMHGNDTLKNEKLGNLDESCSISGNQTAPLGTVSMVESMSSEADLILAEPKKNLDGKEILAKNCSKKNTRKSKKCDGSKDFTFKSSGTKRKPEVKNVECGESMDIQHMKLKVAKSNSVKVLSQGMTGDAAELTVEDLISIAEEFLTSDKEMQKEQSVARKSESNSIPISSSESSIPHRGEFRSCQVLSKCTQTRSSHLKESATSTKKIIGSGDAAQDMLELFLGPLLNKSPPVKEPDPDVTRELLASTYESGSLVRSFVDVAKQVTFIKKKSSLKDKVAMFF
ncbi:hypothetical protein KFK09_014728 [Dendrobium nobile]|uniref:Uncharacterized protein n=1 Tax=Dendrobium nobile TaxID=94219 RepID=A0A8T3B477_DENNO|nr:hypothetical protein KFK09_014728 [Dendrobium nobile]